MSGERRGPTPTVLLTPLPAARTIVAMSSPLACVICSLDPQTSSLILPFAQATIVAAPVILRDEIRRGARAIRQRRSGRAGPTPVRPARSATKFRNDAEGER